ncbi:hypothetical protein SVIOM342S_00490 [Streptomyces violaceorubidus]
MTAATGSLGTAVSTSVDMTEGIIARFKTMAIFRPAILIARVISSVLQTLTSMALVLAVAWAMGFRPTPPRSSGSRPSRCSPPPASP